MTPAPRHRAILAARTGLALVLAANRRFVQLAFKSATKPYCGGRRPIRRCLRPLP